MIPMQEIIEAFFEEVASGNIEIYNEFSFQHELGIFLRKRLKSAKVQFERNVSYFGLDKNKFENFRIKKVGQNSIQKNTIILPLSLHAPLHYFDSLKVA